MIKDNDTYTYVIAKVEHAEWFDGETLEKNFGFPSENKVWKSAVIILDVVNDAVMLSSIHCYLNHPAKYWTESFLEVDEAKNDTTNTLAVMKAVDKVLSPLRDTAPIDYYNARQMQDQLHDVVEAFRKPLCGCHSIPDDCIIDGFYRFFTVPWERDLG